MELQNNLDVISRFATTEEKVTEIRKKAYQVITFLNHPKVVKYYRLRGQNTERKLSELRRLLIPLYRYP